MTRSSSAGSPYRVTLIPGDGTGPELVREAVRALEATGVRFSWDVQKAGESAVAETGTPLPDDVLASLRKNGLGLKGPITTPIGSGFRSVNVAMRQELDLYACVRPIKTFQGARSRFADLDLVVIRENTEDLYTGVEFEIGTPEIEQLRELARKVSKREIRSDSSIAFKPISRFASQRITRFAIEYAQRVGYRRVTAVHKANILKLTDGLFLDTARQVASAHPEIEFQDQLVDSLCMQLVQHPERYQVLLMPNLYGDILSDLVAGLAGGLGVAPGANIGEKIALFEPTHGSAPQFRGSNRLNPVATILSGVLLMRHVDEEKAADRLEQAVAEVIAAGECVTFDLLDSPDDPRAASTQEMTDAIIHALQELREAREHNPEVV